ncbi:hypothetical protein FWK35_00011567 [Aphis craccivora]|uniref:Uncharacterized protein n=1 Tax=Aphis craccivora TaxID=307492 RepID=A0A6G0Z7C6_APHCR|nr:hypothetical protein FWK35_00011567 [Aphis craccivora]
MRNLVVSFQTFFTEKQKLYQHSLKKNLTFSNETSRYALQIDQKELKYFEI